MLIWRTIKYLQYLVNGKTRHGVHSPFVYHFIESILNSNKINNNCKKVGLLRKNLEKSNEYIDAIDYGAGSKLGLLKKRKISDMVRSSSKNKKFGELLYRLTSNYKPKKIVELGTSLGISSCYLSLGNPEAKIYTFEGCSQTAKKAKENFKLLALNKIDIIVGNFDNTLAEKIDKIEKIDMAFIDGNHQEQATVSYFDKLLNYSHDKTIIIIDDIYWSKGMSNAWNKIKKNTSVTVTIDLFFLGIVFLNKELSKEDFVLRF